MFWSHVEWLSWNLSFLMACAFCPNVSLLLAAGVLQVGKTCWCATGHTWPLGVTCQAAVILSFIHKFSKHLLRAHKMLVPRDLERTMRNLLSQEDLGATSWVTHFFSFGSCFLLVHLFGTLSAKMWPSQTFMFCCGRVACLRPLFLPRITITDG